MSTYLIFTRDKTIDQRELDIYSKEAGATLAGHEAQVLAFYGPHEDLEDSITEGTVILQFSNKVAAKAWYESPAYKRAREHRFKGAKFRVTLVEGIGSI